MLGKSENKQYKNNNNNTELRENIDEKKNGPSRKNLLYQSGV